MNLNLSTAMVMMVREDMKAARQGSVRMSLNKKEVMEIHIAKKSSEY